MCRKKIASGAFGGGGKASIWGQLPPLACPNVATCLYFGIQAHIPNSVIQRRADTQAAATACKSTFCIRVLIILHQTEFAFQMQSRTYRTCCARARARVCVYTLKVYPHCGCGIYTFSPVPRRISVKLHLRNKRTDKQTNIQIKGWLSEKRADTRNRILVHFGLRMWRPDGSNFNAFPDSQLLISCRYRLILHFYPPHPLNFNEASVPRSPYTMDADSTDEQTNRQWDKWTNLTDRRVSVRLCLRWRLTLRQTRSLSMLRRRLRRRAREVAYAWCT